MPWRGWDTGDVWGEEFTKSVLVEAAVRKQIVEGKGIMPPFGEKLRDGEVEALVVYVMSLRLQVPR